MKRRTYIQTLIDEVIDVVTFAKDVKGTLKGKSYADANRLATLEPFAIYSRDLSNEPYMEEVQQLALSIFVSYYLVAVQSVADVNRAEIVKVLSAVNPDVGLEGWTPPLDDITELPMPGNEVYRFLSPQVATEVKRTPGSLLEDPDYSGDFKETDSASSVSAKLVPGKSEATAIGKHVEITLSTRLPPDEQGEKDEKGKRAKSKKTTITTYVKQLNIPIEPKIIAGQLALQRRDHSFSERWMKWRSKRIRFVQDFIFAEDIIQEEKRLQRHPDSEVFSKIKERHRAGLLKSARGRGDSYGVGSNTIIISSDVLDEVERMSKHSISSGSMLDDIFSSLGFMMLFVINKEDEMLTMYFKNINKGSVHSIKSIVKMNGGGKDGPDILGMIRDLSKSDLPNF